MRRGVRDFEQPCRGPRILGGGHRTTRGRPIDRQPMPAEDQEVEVELARSPATADLPAERALHGLQGDQERHGRGRRIRPGRDIQGDDRVAELRLVADADRLGRVQPGHAAQACPRERGQGVHGGSQRRLGVADVRPETDVCPRPLPARHPGARPSVQPGRRR